MKRNPLRAADKREEAEKFIEGAEKPVGRNPAPAKKKYPWDDADPEVVKLFNLRLSKPLKLKLEYIIKNTSHSSVHGFIMGEIEKAVQRELKKLESGE